VSAQTPPISHRPAPEAGGSGGGAPPGGPTPADVTVGADRFEILREKLKLYGPYAGYTAFFFFALLLFIYWSFPYDRVRDKIIAEFEKSQKSPPGAPKQTLSIGKLEPSWFTGVILKDVALTTIPADPNKASSVLRAEEVRARISFGSIFSSAKDLTFSAKAIGGTIEGSITHKASAAPATPTPGKKDTGPKYDRTIKMDLDNISLAELGPLRDAVGTAVGGTLKGTIDVTYGETRIDKANGTVAFEVENFWVSDGKTPFKVPALKAVFGSEDITLPQIVIGNVPVQISVKNGVATIEKFEGKGKDLELNVDGRVTLRENVAESDLGVGLRFKFNDTYKKKGESTAGLLLLLDSEPKLRASKRPDGFYALRAQGPLGNPIIAPQPGGGAAGGLGLPPGMKMPGAP
jgi:type II secretion system protein N